MSIHCFLYQAVCIAYNFQKWSMLSVALGIEIIKMFNNSAAMHEVVHLLDLN